MDERDWLAERFHEHRPRLRAVAYRMLGSTSEADDAVQEAWIRLSRSNAGEIDKLEAWLVTVVGRVALNMLRSRKTRREEPLDAHLPDPIVDRADGLDPEHEALLADSVGLALLVVLETLTPAERLAYVVHDMFSVAFDEIGAVLDRSPEAARQLASRGRRRTSTARPAGSRSSTERGLRDRRSHAAGRADHDHGHPPRPGAARPPRPHGLRLPTMSSPPTSAPPGASSPAGVVTGRRGSRPSRAAPSGGSRR
jgi:RNA polymerase sigma factor (sigma-70 family)